MSPYLHLEFRTYDPSSRAIRKDLFHLTDIQLGLIFRWYSEKDIQLSGIVATGNKLIGGRNGSELMALTGSDCIRRMLHPEESAVSYDLPIHSHSCSLGVRLTMGIIPET